MVYRPKFRCGSRPVVLRKYVRNGVVVLVARINGKVVEKELSFAEWLKLQTV